MRKESIGANFVLIAIILVSAGAIVSAAIVDGNFDTSLDPDAIYSGNIDPITSDIDGNFDIPSPGDVTIAPLIKTPEILLKSRQFIPEPGISQTFETELLASEEAAVHVLLQLYHAPTDAERRLLEENNVKLLAYIPNNAWFASIPPKSATRIVALPAVRWVSKILPEDKIAPQIRDDGVGPWAVNEDGTVNLTILFFRDFSLDDASRLISDYGGTTVGRAPIMNALTVVVLNETISHLASEDSVQWINEMLPPVSDMNDGSRAAIGANPLQTAPYNLDGTDVQIGEWESNGWVNTSHPDLVGRVTIADNESADNNTYPEGKVYGYGEDVIIGDHATHVAGTMAGDGNLSESEGGTPLQWRGMATNATIFSYEGWGDGGLSEFDFEYADAINDRGIDLSQNSWGSVDSTGTYDAHSAALDKVIRGDDPNMSRAIPIVWIAGNSGPSWMSLSRPGGSAKNVIVVGATNSNDDSIASFSSRGPTGDNRTKPDVMASGSEVGGDMIKSTGTGEISPDRYPYYSNQGTSFAAPAVSGSVALMLQDYRATHNDSDPFPSTLKAVLMHTAKDLNNTGPDFSSGYGRIDVLAAVNLIRADSSQQRIFEDEIDDLEMDTYNITVPAGVSELKVTLVWDDYPGTPNSGKMLVNDLNLVVIGPDETKYYPWVLNASDLDEPATTGIDDINNVEQVVITSPASGVYNITVNGSDVQNPPQNYSLILPDVTLPTVTVTSPSGITTDIPPELNFTIDEPAHAIYSWDLEGNISGCRMCTSFNTTYGESVLDENTSILLHFNENFGDTAFDDSANGNDGTVGNATLATHPDWTSGRFASALDFDGVDDFVKVADDDSIDFDNESNHSFTMMFWVKTDDSAFLGEQYLFDKSSGSVGDYNGYHMFIDSANSYKLQFMYHQAATVDVLDVSSTGPIYDGEWHHIAVVRNVTADEGYLYIDGILNSSAEDNTTDPEDNSGNLYIGAHGPAWDSFNGTMDEFHIIGRALSPTEIGDVYNKTLPDGLHTVTVYANDTAGNMQSSTAWFILNNYTIPLSQGWNLISIPLDQDNWSISSLLDASIEGNYSVVFAYIDGVWKKSTAVRPTTRLTEMTLEYGYWVYMTAPDTLEIDGTVPSNTTVNMNSGWSLVGYPSFTTQNLTTVLSPVNYTVVFAYIDGVWKKSTAARNPLTNMTSGYGYWIYANEAGSYEVTN